VEVFLYYHVCFCIRLLLSGGGGVCCCSKDSDHCWIHCGSPQSCWGPSNSPSCNARDRILLVEALCVVLSIKLVRKNIGSQQTPTVPAQMLMANLCWWDDWIVARGFVSAHTCWLWKLRSDNSVIMHFRTHVVRHFFSSLYMRSPIPKFCRRVLKHPVCRWHLKVYGPVSISVMSLQCFLSKVSRSLDSICKDRHHYKRTFFVYDESWHCPHFFSRQMLL
jgi:hypothetical protein